MKKIFRKNIFWETKFFGGNWGKKISFFGSFQPKKLAFGSFWAKSVIFQPNFWAFFGHFKTKNAEIWVGLTKEDVFREDFLAKNLFSDIFRSKNLFSTEKLNFWAYF